MEKKKQKNLKRSREQLIQSLIDSSEQLSEIELLELTSTIQSKKTLNLSEEKSDSNEKVNKQVIPFKNEGQDIQQKLKFMNIESQNDEDEEYFQLEPMNELFLSDVDGDGNCLWYSLCKTIRGKTNGYKQLKTYLLLMTQMQYNRISIFLPGTTGQQYFDEYIQERAWGNIDHIGEIIADCLGRSIFLYSEDENLKRQPNLIYGRNYNLNPIRIYYNGTNHYKAVLVRSKETKMVLQTDVRSIDKIMADLVYDFFSFRIFGQIDQTFTDPIDENPDFHDQLLQNTYCFDQVVDFFEDYFDLDLKYNQVIKSTKNSSKKQVSILQLPAKIFEISSLAFDFNCCSYKQKYPLFNDKQDAYNDKYKHLQSIEGTAKKCDYYYPDRISQISNYKKRSKKMNKFRNSMKNYGLENCSHCKNLRLVYYEKDADDNVKKQFIIYEDQIDDIISLIHNTTHRKRDHILQIIKRMQIIIPHAKILVYQFISNCKQCSQEPTLRKRPGTKQIISQKPLERIQMDCMELHNSLQQNGYIQLLNIKDHFSRFSKSYPIKNKKAETISDCLQDFFSNQGVPQILHTDNGLEFNNQTIISLCQEYNVEYIKGRPYHPQSQGSIERFNRWIHRRLIMIYENSEKFDLRKSIHQLVFDYNNTKSRITKTTPISAIKLDNTVKEDQEKIQQIISSVQSTFPKSKNPLDFNIGDKALLSNEVTNSAGKNVIIKKPTLKKKSGKLKLYNIPVTITQVNNLNVCIKIDNQNENNLYINQDYLCPVQYLKQVTEQCWEKFLKEKENQILDMLEQKNELNDDSEESSYSDQSQETKDNNQEIDEKNENCSINESCISD